MRKNVKKQLALRVLSTAALVAMVSSIATAAFADTYDLNKGSVEIVAKDGSQSITQWADKDKGTFVQDENGENIDHRPDSDIILTTKDEATGETKPTSNTVTITAEEKGDTANVTLQDVFINREGARRSDSEAALTVKGDGDTNIELNGNNTLSSTGGHAGLEKTDAECAGTLTITDDKNNNRSDKRKDEDGYSTGGDTGTLDVIGGGEGGAGIGGQGTNNYWDSSSDPGAQNIHSTSNITITGGSIRAGKTPTGCDRDYHWATGAGIGSGNADYSKNAGNGTDITITGNADVVATGGRYSAGIGGGYNGNGSDIIISGNAKVVASGSVSGGAGIGGGDCGTGSVFITDNADVTAYGGNQGAGIGGGLYRGGSVEISGNAKVTAVGANGSAGIGSGYNYGSSDLDTNVTISENANVTAVGSYGGAAIGTGYRHKNGKTTINITGGTVTAISGKNAITYDGEEVLPSAIGGGSTGRAQDVTVTINGTTGNTTINASCSGNVESAISKGNGTTDIIGYDEDGKSPFGEDGSVIVRMYNHGSYTMGHGSFGEYEGDLTGYNLGTLYQTVHNRKYMDENPNIDTKKLEDEDLHDWKLVGKVVEPTLEKDGYADYICGIDKCGQTKHVVLPKLTPEPSKPDTTDPDVPGGNTPDTPNKPDTPKQPDGTTPAPVTPDAPVQDSTAPADTLAADTTADAAAVPADAAVAPAAAQNVVQDAKPEAAAPAAAAAAVLPQTGANWLAVAGSALSGLFLLAAGFVLDRKGRRMN